MDILVSLLSQNLPSDYAVILPMRGQKHLMPSAKWGYITSDSGVVSWNEESAFLFRLMLAAREAGAKKSDYEKQAPSLAVLQKAGPEAFSWWETFKRWSGTPHFEIAQYLAVGVTSK
jgi:hypothetical protein